MAIFSARRKICYLLLPPSDVFSNSTLEEFAGCKQSELTLWWRDLKHYHFCFIVLIDDSPASWILLTQSKTAAEFLLIIQKSCCCRYLFVQRLCNRKDVGTFGKEKKLLCTWSFLVCFCSHFDKCRCVNLKVKICLSVPFYSVLMTSI